MVVFKIAKKRDYKTDIKVELLSLGYDIISNDDEYVNMTTNIRFRCNECGKIFERTPKSALKSNCHCQKCTQKIIVGEKIHNIKSVDNKIIKLMKDNNISDYIIKNNSSIVIFNCVKCGKQIKRKYDVLLRCSYPFYCKECINKLEKPTLNAEMINEKLKQMNNNTICIQDGYFTWKDRVQFKCECGRIFERKPNTVISQKLFYCSYCSKRISCGEREIIDILNKNNINYVHQKTFDDCKNKLLLPFDFYLPDKNILIEYDGELHYKDVFGNLERQKENDDIKNKYCKENNITLIRIPYWENIEDNILKIIYGDTVSSQL